MTWFPDWSGETVVIVGSGPSAVAVPIERARGRARVVVVNSSWQLAPWADLLYAHSVYWWRANQAAASFQGMRVAVDPETADEFPGTHLVKVRLDPHRANERRIGDRFVMEMLFDRPGVIGWGKNGGFQVTNLVAQFRPARIVLVGMDATIEHGVHWHGMHPGPKNPTEADTAVWRRHFDGAAPVLAERGIEVLNASTLSTLTAYRKVDFVEALC